MTNNKNNEQIPKNEDQDFIDFEDRHQQILKNIHKKIAEYLKKKYNSLAIKEILYYTLGVARMDIEKSHIKSNFSSLSKTGNIDDIESAYQDHLKKCKTLQLQKFLAFEDLKIDLKQFIQEICTDLQQQIDKEQL